MSNAELIEEGKARIAGAYDSMPTTKIKLSGDLALLERLANALEASESSRAPRVIQDRAEWMALPEHSVVRIQFVTRAGVEEVWHVHRISGTGGAASGNAELAGNWAKVWETYRESHHVLAACLRVLYSPEPI